MIRTAIFRLIRLIVEKYYPESLVPIYGSGELKGRVISWKWHFESTWYEKFKKKGWH